MERDGLHLGGQARRNCDDLSQAIVTSRMDVVRTKLLQPLALVTALPYDLPHVGFHHLPWAKVDGKLVRRAFEKGTTRNRQHRVVVTSWAPYASGW